MYSEKKTLLYVRKFCPENWNRQGRQNYQQTVQTEQWTTVVHFFLWSLSNFVYAISGFISLIQRVIELDIRTIEKPNDRANELIVQGGRKDFFFQFWYENAWKIKKILLWSNDSFQFSTVWVLIFSCSNPTTTNVFHAVINAL